jgi:hypothetical protein
LVVGTRKIALASLFGVLILAITGFIPPPTSDYLIIFQSFFLGLSYLLVGRGGATYVGAVSGLLITFVKFNFFPLDLVFSIIFGVLVDLTAEGFRARDGQRVRTGRLAASLMVSSGIVGFLAYYVTAVATNLVPNEFVLDLSVLIFGVVSGGIGGVAAARVWNRNLMARFQGSL